MNNNPITASEDLRVREMQVIWRDTFIVEDAPPNFLEVSQRLLRRMPSYLADSETEPRRDQPEFLRVSERVSRGVASLGYDNLLRVQFSPFDITDLTPTLDRLRVPPARLTPQQIDEAAFRASENHEWILVTPILLLHRAGVGTMQYHVTYRHSPGFTPDEAIARVRMGIRPMLISLNSDWHSLLPDDTSIWRNENIVTQSPNRNLMITSLRDLSQGVLSARLGASHPNARRRRRKKRVSARALPPTPTGSTTVILTELDPMPGSDVMTYVAQHARPLRGIGAMDADWRNRADWLVIRELDDNLSTDSEMGMFLLGNSELLVFNNKLETSLNQNKRRLHLRSRENALAYFYMHYVVLMEWIYLQDALLRSYIQRLDKLTAAATPDRARMLRTLRGALADLIQYREDITPYANRIEFLERARAYHKIDRLAERFERKQELLLNYASEYHDHREARATEFLNWLVGILSGAALAELVITLGRISAEQTVAYLGVYAISIAIVLGVMAVLLRRT